MLSTVYNLSVYDNSITREHSYGHALMHVQRNIVFTFDNNRKIKSRNLTMCLQYFVSLVCFFAVCVVVLIQHIQGLLGKVLGINIVSYDIVITVFPVRVYAHS